MSQHEMYFSRKKEEKVERKTKGRGDGGARGSSRHGSSIILLVGPLRREGAGSSWELKLRAFSDAKTIPRKNPISRQFTFVSCYCCDSPLLL